MPFVENYQEFAARHGKSLNVNGRLLYPDGAMSDEMGFLRQEPPDDLTARLRLQRAYVEEQLRREVNQRNEFVSDCEQQASYIARGYNVPAPPDNAPEIVREFTGKIRELEGQLRAFDAQLASQPSVQHRRQRELDAERRQAAVDTLRKAIREACQEG